MENIGNGAHLLVVVAVVVLVLVVVVIMPVVMVMVIFGFRKKSNGLRCLAYVATAKSPKASSRSSQKMKGGKYKGVLLLLSLRKQDRCR